MLSPILKYSDICLYKYQVNLNGLKYGCCCYVSDINVFVLQAPAILTCLEQKRLSESSEAKLRKLSVKLIQRLGLTFLKPRLAAWRSDTILTSCLYLIIYSEQYCIILYQFSLDEKQVLNKVFFNVNGNIFRYQRGSRSLAANLSMSQPITATDAATPEAETQDQEEDYDIPEELETVIGKLPPPLTQYYC